LSTKHAVIAGLDIEPRIGQAFPAFNNFNRGSLMHTKVALAVVLQILATASLFAGTPELPAPTRSGGKPLMEALAARHSAREFAEKALEPQVLSDLLWAACGVNRADGKRTTPTAVNWQEIDVYVATAEGLFRFEPTPHALKQIAPDDVRPNAGSQGFVKAAPVVLIYVADFNRMGKAPEADRLFYSATDVGFIAQNVYLYCASAGLNTVVVGWIDKDTLARRMGLAKNQKILLAQPVGYPQE